MNVPGSHRGFPLILCICNRYKHGSGGVTHGLPGSSTAPPPPRTLRAGGAAAGCLHLPGALPPGIPAAPGAAAAAVPPPRPPPRGAERRCRPGASRGSAGSLPPLTSGGSSGRGFPPDVSAGRAGVGQRRGARRGRRLSRGSREAAVHPHPVSLRRRNFSPPRTPRRASLRGGTTSHGAQNPAPRRHPEPRRLPSRFQPTFLPLRCCFPRRREGAPSPPRPGSRPLSSGTSSSRRSPLLCLSLRLHHPPLYSRAGSAGIYSGGKSRADVMLLIASPKEREEGNGARGGDARFPPPARLGTARNGAIRAVPHRAELCRAVPQVPRHLGASIGARRDPVLPPLPSLSFFFFN